MRPVLYCSLRSLTFKYISLFVTRIFLIYNFSYCYCCSFSVDLFFLTCKHWPYQGERGKIWGRWADDNDDDNGGDNDDDGDNNNNDDYDDDYDDDDDLFVAVLIVGAFAVCALLSDLQLHMSI